MKRVLLALVSTLFLVTQVMAGAWTSNNFLYKPAIGGRGVDEKAKFDSGLNRVDSRLANEKWLNDSLYNGNLATAITTIGNAKTVLSIPSGNWSIATDLTVPPNLTVKFAHGALLTIATGQTLTINGPIEAGLYQIFSCTGTGKVVLGGDAISMAYPQWWGAKGDGSTLNGAALNAALTAVREKGIKLVLTAGTYLVDAELNTYRANMEGIVGPNYWDYKVTLKPTAACARLLKMGTTAKNHDRGIIKNFFIDLSTAPNNHIAIGSDYGIQGKTVDNIHIHGVIGSEVTKNFTGIKLTTTATLGTQLNSFKNIWIQACFTGIDALNYSGTTLYGINQCYFEDVHIWWAYRSFIIGGYGNKFMNCDLFVTPKIANGNEADYAPNNTITGHAGLVSWSGLSQGNIFDTCWWEDVGDAVAKPLGYVTQDDIFIGQNTFETELYVQDAFQVIASGVPYTASSNWPDGQRKPTVINAHYNSFRSIAAPWAAPNMLANGYFNFWSYGDSIATPADDTLVIDNWKTSLSGGTINPVYKSGTSLKNFGSTCKLTITAAGTTGACGIKQVITDPYKLRYQGLTLIARVKTDTAATLSTTLTLIEGANTKTLTRTVTQDWTTMTVFLRSLDNSSPSAITAYIGASSGATGVLYIDYIALYPGQWRERDACPDYVSANLEAVKSGFVKIATRTPSSATDYGTAGEVRWDASYIYICVATNTWKRAAIATWP